MQSPPIDACDPALDFDLIRTPIVPDQRCNLPKRRFMIAAGLVALLLHGYAFSILPSLMDVDFPEEVIAEGNLENADIGIDPEYPTNYNIEHIDELGVPPRVNPREAVLISTVNPPPTVLSGVNSAVRRLFLR